MKGMFPEEAEIWKPIISFCEASFREDREAKYVPALAQGKG
jgi:hypothetical protein